jgi:hypothetical protein
MNQILTDIMEVSSAVYAMVWLQVCIPVEVFIGNFTLVRLLFAVNLFMYFHVAR